MYKRRGKHLARLLVPRRLILGDGGIAAGGEGLLAEELEGRRRHLEQQPPVYLQHVGVCVNGNRLWPV